MNPNDSEMQMKQTRQNSSNENQPRQTTQNRGDVTGNKKQKTHTTRQKKETPLPNSFSLTREK